MQSAAAPSPARFVVQNLIRRHEIALICGALNVGKTTLALQFYDDFCHGRALLNTYPSLTVPACFISCNRSRESLRYHMETMSLDPYTLPHLALPELIRYEEYNLATAYKHAKELVPNLRVLFLDGIGMLIQGKQNDPRDMSQFMADSTRFCYTNELTIIGTAGAAKAKQGAGYVDILERTSGSGEIMAQSDTKIVLDRYKQHDPTDPNRTITIYATRRPTIRLWAKFSSEGTLSIQSDPPEGYNEPVASPAQQLLTQWLTQYAEETLELGDLRTVTNSANISRASLYRWLDDQLELGMLERCGKGKYLVIQNAKSPLQ